MIKHYKVITATSAGDLIYHMHRAQEDGWIPHGPTWHDGTVIAQSVVIYDDRQCDKTIADTLTATQSLTTCDSACATDRAAAACPAPEPSE